MKKILLNSVVALIVGGVIITGVVLRSLETQNDVKQARPIRVQSVPVGSAVVSIEPQMPDDSLYAPEYYDAGNGRFRPNLVDPSDVDVTKITNTAILNNVFGNTNWTVARPIYIEKLPPDFGQYGDYLLYVQAVLPLILRENKKIMADKEVLFKLAEKFADKTPWTAEEQVTFDNLAQKYDIYSQKVTDAQLAELLERVQPIPPSLAIAMSAVQTNWGRQNMDAPFGQKTWLDGRYVFKPFATLPEAVHAYMMELNTLPQYKTMRMRRQIYQNVRGSKGLALADEMQPFMADDAQYVGKIKAMYETNDLGELDGAILDE